MPPREEKILGLEPATRLGKRKHPIAHAELEHHPTSFRTDNESSINNCVGSIVGPSVASEALRSHLHSHGKCPPGVVLSSRSHVPLTIHESTKNRSIQAQKIQDAADLVATARQLQQDRMQQGTNKNGHRDAFSIERHSVLGLPVTKNPPTCKLDPQSNTDAISENKSEDQGEQRMRLIWSQELHNRFLNALSHLGLKKAVPKSILGLMNVEGMTRENIASHLQKYRIYLKKMGGYAAKDKISTDTLQELHEDNVRQMASQEAMQQNVSIMDDEVYEAAIGTADFHEQVESEYPTAQTNMPDSLANVVEGIPISDSLPAVQQRLYSRHQKESLCPAVAAVSGGHFDPQSWQYPKLPGEETPASQYPAKAGENHIDGYNHLPVKHHDDQTDILFDGRHDNHSESDNAAACQEDFDDDLLIEKSSIHHHE